MTSPLRTVLITGCSSGIGKVSAQLLAQQGFRVLAGVRSKEQAAEFTDQGLPNLEPVLLEVTSEEDVLGLIKHLEGTCPEGLHALINNAGIGLPAAVELSKLEDVRRLFEINAIAPLRLIQHCLPLLRKSRGRIINVSSMNGDIALPMVGAYSASKFAMEAFSDTLRIELRPWQIPVSLVRPGQVRTPIFDKARQAIEEHRQEIPLELKTGYDQMYARAAKFNDYGCKSSTPPEKVAKVVLRATTAKRPRIRYHVGIDAHGMRLLNSILPQFLIDRMLARVMRVLKPLD